jgi:hypothetical protein
VALDTLRASSRFRPRQEMNLGDVGPALADFYRQGQTIEGAIEARAVGLLELEPEPLPFESPSPMIVPAPEPEEPKPPDLELPEAELPEPEPPEPEADAMPYSVPEAMAISSESTTEDGE